VKTITEKGATTQHSLSIQQNIRLLQPDRAGFMHLWSTSCSSRSLPYSSTLIGRTVHTGLL